MNKKGILLASSAMMASIVVGGPVTAQTAGDRGNTIETVVVTAEHVATNAQKTPIALTVYTGAQLSAAGVHGMRSLAAIDPSVNVTSNYGSFYVAIRGIASQNVSELGDPAVAIARDGFYTNQSYGVQAAMYDLQRIEILKGPQGTLSGRNAVGGLVNIITQKPQQDFGGYISLTGGSYALFGAEGAINVPLGDKVQLRLSGLFRRHDGYRKVTGGANQRGDDENTASGRVMLAFEPFTGFRGLAWYQYQVINQVGDISEETPLGVVTPLTNTQTWSKPSPTHTYLSDSLIRWQFSYDRLPLGLTLTYLGGYDEVRYGQNLGAAGSYPATRQFNSRNNPRTWNHEVRIATPVGRRFFFQGGYYHSNDSNFVSTGIYDLQMDPPFAGTSRDYSHTYGLYFDYPSITTQSDAVYGQGSYKITSQLKFSLGARYTWDKKFREGTSTLFLPALISPFAPNKKIVNSGEGNVAESQATYHVGLDYTPTDNTLIYAKFDTGYKVGGFTQHGTSPTVSYGPEKVKSYELGTKNTLMNRRLQLNADAFYMDYTGYQAQQQSAVLAGQGTFNVGSAKIYGAELEVVALLPEDNRFNLNATYLHTRFGNNITVEDGNGVPWAIGGNRLPNAPEFVATAGFEHEFAFTGGTLSARIEGKYSTSYYFSVFNTPDTEQKSYATGNASLTYMPDDANWSLQAYAHNFTDETVLAFAERNFNSMLNSYEFAPPATFGLRARYNF